MSINGSLAFSKGLCLNITSFTIVPDNATIGQTLIGSVNYDVLNKTGTGMYVPFTVTAHILCIIIVRVANIYPPDYHKM